MNHCSHPNSVSGLDHDYCPDCGQYLIPANPRSYVTSSAQVTPELLHKNGEIPSYKTANQAIKLAIDKLPAPEQNELLEWLNRKLKRPEIEAIDIPTQAGREVVRVIVSGSVVYRNEKVKCGKEKCKTCPHGPYWYSYQRVDGKLKSKYIGKKLPE